jgi:hypothetical protein
MNALLATNTQSLIPLRSRAADFFKMDLSCAVRENVPRDLNPLRWTLTSPRGMELWESNENMCLLCGN